MLQSFARQWVRPFVDPRQVASILRLPRLWAGWRRPPGPEAGPASHAGVSGKRREREGEAPSDPHRFYPAAWAGRLLAKSRPSVHADIGSRAPDVGVLSALVPLTIFVDRRPLQAQLPGLASVAGDLTRLPFPDKSLISLSSLHVIGQAGQSRRGGGAVELAEAVAAFGELQRVLGYRGSLYLSAPVGRERVSHGQWIFAPETILKAVPFLRLRRFSYVGDDRLLRADAPLDKAAQQHCGCGLFEFQRS